MKKYTDSKGKTWEKEDVLALLNSSDTALMRALEVVTMNQTADEQTSEQTKYHNGEGYTGVDAKIMTSIYHWYKKKGWVSPKQKAVVHKKIRKYWRQILVAIAKKDEAGA